MLSIIKINEKEKWNEIVRSFDNYDIYYLSNYVEAFQLHGDGEPLLFYFEHNNMKAINVVMKRDISKDNRFIDTLPSNTFFDLATPYGFGGFLLEGNISEENINVLDEVYNAICQKEGIISEVVRFHPVLRNYQSLNQMYDISSLSKTITIEMDSIEQVQKNIAKSNKYKIRKPKKSGVEIYSDWNYNLMEEFIALYNSTMKNNDATDYYFFNKDFYMNVLEELENHANIFYATYENRKIAMAIILRSNNQLHYHLSALDRDFGHLRPMNLLIYEAACWGLEQGYNTFHLGGGLGSREDSLYEFKRSFNQNSSTVFKLGKKVFLKDEYEQLLDIRKNKFSQQELKKNYFPEYRS